MLLGKRQRSYICTPGDSYVDGANGVAFKTSLRTSVDRGLTSIAAGGATMSDIATQVSSNSDLRRQCQFIIWDGYIGGYGTVAAYLALCASLVASVGAANVMFVSPVRRSIMSAQENADTSLIQTALAGLYNYVDAQAALVAAGNPVADASDIASNYVPTSLLQVDLTHLTQPGMDIGVTAVRAKMVAINWPVS